MYNVGPETGIWIILHFWLPIPVAFFCIVVPILNWWLKKKGY